MKKIIAMLLALFALTAFCSCGVSELLERAVSRGTTGESVYRNEKLNITFTKSDDMVFLTDEEIASLMNISKDLMTNGDEIFEIAGLTSVTDFLAKNPVTGNNVALVFEDLVKTGNSTISESQYLDASKRQLSGQAGFNYTFGETSSVKLGGETYVKLDAQATYGGTRMHQGFYVRKVGTYMVVITITTVDDTPLATYEAMFS